MTRTSLRPSPREFLKDSTPSLQWSCTATTVTGQSLFSLCIRRTPRSTTGVLLLGWGETLPEGARSQRVNRRRERGTDWAVRELEEGTEVGKTMTHPEGGEQTIDTQHAQSMSAPTPASSLQQAHVNDAEKSSRTKLKLSVGTKVANHASGNAAPALAESQTGEGGVSEKSGSWYTNTPETVRQMVYDPRLVPSAERTLHSSVVLQPKQREEWFELVDEVWHLCREAERRQRKHPPESLPVAEGIARAFIAQRMDIDEPLHGYLVRRRHEGWLQGCAWATHFTHWCRHFRWDSLAPNAGIKHMSSVATDRDGQLTRELEQQPCEGDADNGGVAFPRVAEIGLIAALGCGGFLLKLLLEELRQSGRYDFAVVHATPDSMRFYEKYGFMRVGAVAKYSKWRSGENEMGYRHWLSTDEELTQNDKPSIMMAQRLQPGTGSTDALRLMRQVYVDTCPLIQRTEVPRLPTPEEQQEELLAQAQRMQQGSNDGGEAEHAQTNEAELQPDGGAALGAGARAAALRSDLLADDVDDMRLRRHQQEMDSKSRSKRLTDRQQQGMNGSQHAASYQRRGGASAINGVYDESPNAVPTELSVLHTIRANGRSNRSERMKRKHGDMDPHELFSADPESQQQVRPNSHGRSKTPRARFASPPMQNASPVAMPPTMPATSSSSQRRKAAAAFAATGKAVPWANNKEAIAADDASASTVPLQPPILPGDSSEGDDPEL